MRISKSFIIAASMLLNISFATSQSYLPHSDGEVVRHTYYTLSYIEEHEQAEWVAYEMTPRNAESNVTRNDSFKADPKVSTASALPTDYQGSGYDRGHLCPAASMSFDKVAMEESFYMSNMSPQAPTFNRDGWMRLEKLVRGWAAADSVIYVVTGPILSNPKGSA
ncbi:MAG: DNA/RNA non-specific endonuclease, partial [Rikenellaceae bacterium]